MWLKRRRCMRQEPVPGTIPEQGRQLALRRTIKSFRRLTDGRYLSSFQSVRISLGFLDLIGRPQYGPRGFRGRACCERRKAASVETMSDARENGDRGKAHT